MGTSSSNGHCLRVGVREAAKVPMIMKTKGLSSDQAARLRSAEGIGKSKAEEGMTHVYAIRDIVGFMQLRDVWNPLLQRSSSNTVFLTFEWLSTWLNHFGRQGRLLVLVFKEGEEVVGIAPLIVEVREGFRRLGTIGAQTLEYEDFIISGDCNHEEVLDAFWDVIEKERGWDFFQLNSVREDSGNIQLLRSVLARRRISNILRPSDSSPYVPITQSWEQYWESLSQRFRKDSARLQRRLAQDHGPVSYEEPRTPKDVDTLMQELFRHHLARRQEVSGTQGVFGDEKLRDFYIHLAKELFCKGWLYLPTLRANGKIAAIHLDFEYGGAYLHAVPAFDREFSQYGVGRLLNIHLIRDAFARGPREFDFLRGAELYKFDFACKVRQLYSLSTFAPTVRGFMARQWFERFRPHLQKRAGLRTLVARMRKLREGKSTFHPPTA